MALNDLWVTTAAVAGALAVIAKPCPSEVVTGAVDCNHPPSGQGTVESSATSKKRTLPLEADLSCKASGHRLILRAGLEPVAGRLDGGEGPATFVMRLANLGHTHTKPLKAALGKDGWERTPLIDDCQH